MFMCRSAEEGAATLTQPPGVLLLLARVCTFLESEAVVQVMETLATTFPGQGGGSGSDQPPAFVAGKVARWGLSLLSHEAHRVPD